MDFSLWSDRITRASDKIIWTTGSKLKPKPKLAILHQREIRDDPVNPEVVLHLAEPGYIEPRFGYVVTDSGVLVEQSMQPNEPCKQPWRIGLTSPSEFAKLKSGKGKRVEQHPKVISLRHFWEWNYYHFFMDVLGKIPLYDQIGLDTDIPLVLGRYAIELPFVQQLLAKGALKHRNWLIQDECYIHANEIYFCRTRQSYKHKMDYIMDAMHIPKANTAHNERIFLNRKSGRRITNLEEILPILNEFRFTTIDAAELSVNDQIEVFSKARYLVAIHGAGMTNMIFRRDGQMSVLEMYPSNYVSVDFWNICHEWNFAVDRLACRPEGTVNPQHANLYVEPVELRRKLESMLPQA